MLTYHQSILKMIMTKWLESDYVIIDTETTGLCNGSEIIEIAIINMRGDVLLNTLVKPTRPIPSDVTNINNITNEMVANAPGWAEVFPVVIRIISQHKWLAWNSGFDARMMIQSCRYAGILGRTSPYSVSTITTVIHTSHIDAKAVYSQWYGEFDEKHKNFKRQSLATAAVRHGVSTAGAHRALADCLMILGVLNQVCQKEAV